MAMADFGVTTAQVSIVLSVFMAGLALGSWGGGRLVRRFENRSAGFFVRLMGPANWRSESRASPWRRFSGPDVPCLRFSPGMRAWGSAGYYLASGGWVALVMLPFCTCMGATFPLAMAGIEKSFSFLYLANVLGALVGALSSAFVFIEWIGFSRTLHLAAGMNALVAVLALLVAGLALQNAAGEPGYRARIRVARSRRTDDSSQTLGRRVHPAAPVLLRPLESRHGGGLDTAVCAVARPCGVLLCDDSGGLSSGDGPGFTGVPRADAV